RIRASDNFPIGRPGRVACPQAQNDENRCMAYFHCNFSGSGADNGWPSYWQVRLSNSPVTSVSNFGGWRFLFSLCASIAVDTTFGSAGTVQIDFGSSEQAAYKT